MRQARRSAVVSDADVLIDFVKADLGVLELIATRMWDIYVPFEILDEVDGLDAQTAERIGLNLYEATPEELNQASIHSPSLSERDRLCLHVAKEHNWMCFTNDRALGKACETEGIEVVRSLRSISLLYQTGDVSRARVVEIAQSLNEVNPDFITERLVRDFLKGLH